LSFISNFFKCFIGYGGHSVYVYKMEGIEYTRICSFEGPSSDSTFGVDVEVKGNVIAVGALSTASGGKFHDVNAE
jgi:hypothetical protein